MATATVSSPAAASSSAADATTRQPTACIVIGMAGSGKTTLMQRLNADLHEAKTPYYLVNLDPAVLETPFGANIDVRDTVNYREVMKQYQLGPNGGILTALNFFATRFEQVTSTSTSTSTPTSTPSPTCTPTPTSTAASISAFTSSSASTGAHADRGAARGARGAYAVRPAALRAARHARPNRDFHVVGLWSDHHGATPAR